MKKLINLILLSTALISFSAVSDEEKPVENPDFDRKQLLQILLHHYQSMTGAWFINSQCFILSYEETREYEFYVGELNKVAQQEQIAPLAHLYTMQSNGEQVSKMEKYRSCGKDAESVVKGNFSITKRLYGDIVGSRKGIGDGA